MKKNINVIKKFLKQNLNPELKNFLKKIIKRNVTSNFPYINYNEEFSLNFEVNNSIEEFRLTNWGGEKEYTIKMVKNFKEDDVVYDIGSSVGLVSVISASIVKNGKVISFEPDPENIKRLKNNYIINDLTNYEIKEMAVGETQGKLKLFTKGSNGNSPSLKPINGIESFIETEVNSIDYLISQKEIPYPDVIKIDIEGAEIIALKGMKNLLSSDKRPRLIFIEIHPEFLPSFGSNTEDIFELLAKYDYKFVEKIETHNQILCKLESNI